MENVIQQSGSVADGKATREPTFKPWFGVTSQRRVRCNGNQALFKEKEREKEGRSALRDESERKGRSKWRVEAREAQATWNRGSTISLLTCLTSSPSPRISTLWYIAENQRMKMLLV